MKYLVFAPALPPTPLAVSQRLYHFIEGMKAGGLEVDLVCSSQNSFYPTSFFKLPTNKQRFFWRFVTEVIVGLEWGIRLGFQPRSHIVFSVPPFFSFLVAGSVAALLGRRFTVDMRDLYPDILVHHGVLKEESFLAKTIFRVTGWILTRSYRVVAATEGLKKSLFETHGLSFEKVVTVWNGYDQSIFKPKEKYSVFTCVFHGTLGYFQDVDMLVQLAEKLKPRGLKFVVIGDGPQAFKVKTCSAIEYYEGLPFEEVADVVCRCHVGLSFRKGGAIGETSFPVKIFEYLGAGIPVLTSPDSEAGECVKALEAGCVVGAGDVDRAAEHLLEWFAAFSNGSAWGHRGHEPKTELSRQCLRQKWVESLL